MLKIEKGNKTKDVSKNGSFTTAKELEHTLHWRSQLQEFIIKTKMAYYVKMHKWGKLSRPDLFWLNGISHVEKLENLLFLLEKAGPTFCLDKGSITQKIKQQLLIYHQILMS